METKNNQRIAKKDIIYLIISIWIFIVVYYKSMMETFSIVLGKTILIFRLLLILFAFIHCLLYRQNKKKFLLLVAFSIVVILDYLFADNWLIFELFFISFFWGDKLDYKKVLKIYAYVTLVSILFVIIMNVTGLSPKQFDYFRPNGRYRVTLGFNHPNALSECFMVFLFCLYLLNTKGTKKRVITFVMIISAICIVVFPNTMNVAAVIILVLIFEFLLRHIFLHLHTKKQKKKFFICIIVISILSVMMIYYVVLSKSFDNSMIFKSFGSLFHRVRLTREGLEKYGFSLFGTYYESTTEIAIHVKKNASGYFTIDSVFFLLPIRYGLIATIIFFWFYFKSLYYCIIKNNINLLAVFLAILIMSVVDPFITLFIMSFMFICAKCYKSDEKNIIR